MKSKALAVVLAVAMIALTGCGAKKADVYSAPAATETELSAHAEDDYVEEQEVEGQTIGLEMEGDVAADAVEASDVATADSVDAPEETILEDPYGMYMVDEGWLQEVGGIVVERNGNFYSIANFVDDAVAGGYNVGVKANAVTPNYQCGVLYVYDPNKNRDVPTNASSTLYISCGDFQVIEVSKSEEIRIYSQYAVDTKSFVPVDFYGYTVKAVHATGISEGGSIYTLVDATIPRENLVTGNNPSLCDMSGNSVADVHDLEYGQEYLYGWFEGTQYYETPLIASCKCFVETGNIVDAPVNLTKMGYSIVDVSGLAPGYYVNWNRSVYDGHIVFKLVD